MNAVVYHPSYSMGRLKSLFLADSGQSDVLSLAGFFNNFKRIVNIALLSCDCYRKKPSSFFFQGKQTKGGGKQ